MPYFFTDFASQSAAAMLAGRAEARERAKRTKLQQHNRPMSVRNGRVATLGWRAGHAEALEFLVSKIHKA